MASKQAHAGVAHIRQTTQFTCCAASIASALKAHGKDVSEDDVNRVLGAAPMAGATWEAMLATVQYFGLRGSLVVPATPRLLKSWTDQGLPVVIAWNPENRPWSHASVVFDVVEGANGVLDVHVMDPNIPNPSRTIRVLNEDEFCQKWGEKVSDTLIVRRPAMVIEREVTVAGRQVVASTSSHVETPMAEPKQAKKPQPTQEKKDQNVVTGPGAGRRNQVVQDLIQRGPGGSGHHHTRERDVGKGQSRKDKHKKDWRDKEGMPVEARFPRGESMTLEEVAAVVGAEFQEMNENPPESVLKVREEMGAKVATRERLTWKAAAEPVAVQVQTREAASGLYGHTKAIQAACESASKKLASTAMRIAKQAFTKDAEIVPFLQAHAKREGSRSAKVLLAAMRELGPKVASELRGGIPKEAGAPEYGLYGYKVRTANLGLDACKELRSTAGQIASGLHRRRMADYEKITGFFQEHSKTAKCGYSRMLLSCYPDASVKMAAEKDATPRGVGGWLEWED